MAATAKANTSLPITDSTQSTQVVRGTITLSGDYGASSPSDTNGDKLSLAIFPTQSPKPPLRVLIYEQPAAGTAPTGYVFEYAAGSNASNGLLVVLQTAAQSDTAGPLAQITQGSAYPTALVTAATAGYLKFEAIFPLGQ